MMCNRAGQLAAACGDRVRWVGRSLEQQRGQLGGMEAAVGNLTDIFAAHQREFLRVKVRAWVGVETVGSLSV